MGISPQERKASIPSRALGLIIRKPEVLVPDEILTEEEVHKELRERLERRSRITFGLIADGNRRWAREKFGPAARIAQRFGHPEGSRQVVSLMRHFRDELPPMNMIVWGFSTDNWGRPDDERRELFSLLNETVETMLDETLESDGRIIHLGRKNPLYGPHGDIIIPGLPEPLKGTLMRAEELTRKNKGAIIAPAINYSGSDEFIRMLDRFQGAIEAGEYPVGTPFTRNLYTRFGDDGGVLGEMTVLIRTSGEERLSRFGWRADDPELRWEQKKLPDVTPLDLELNILNALKTEQRQGK